MKINLIIITLIKNIETILQEETKYKVVFNFEVDDLTKEYQRLKDLQIGELPEIYYVNIHLPYWYFTIKDPNENILEITGNK